MGAKESVLLTQVLNIQKKGKKEKAYNYD